jgi:hypothetical protein
MSKSKLCVAIVTGDGFSNAYHHLLTEDSTEHHLDGIKAVVAEQFCKEYWSDSGVTTPFDEMDSPEEAFDEYFENCLKGEDCSIAFFEPGEIPREVLVRMLRELDDPPHS